MQIFRVDVMGKGVLLLCICLFMILLIEPVLAEWEKLDSWSTIVENSTTAMYELEVKKPIFGAIVHLETKTKIQYPYFDGIRITFYNGKGEFRRYVVENDISDLNAVYDGIILFNVKNKAFRYTTDINKIVITLKGGENSFPLLNKEKSNIRIILKEKEFGDHLYTRTRVGECTKETCAESKEAERLPGFEAYARASAGPCTGFIHRWSMVKQMYGIRFKSIKSGKADVFVSYYLGGVGNSVNTPDQFFGAARGAWKLEIDAGLWDIDNVRYVRGPNLLYKASVGYGADVEEIGSMATDSALDVTSDMDDYMEIIEKRSKGKIKFPGKYAKIASKVGKAIDAIGFVTDIYDFYSALQADKLIANGGALVFPGVYLQKDARYEIIIDSLARADAICDGFIQEAWSYVDLCVKNGKPCNSATELEKKIVDRGFAIYDVFISYYPKPLEYTPPTIRIISPADKQDFTEKEEINFKAEISGGWKPYSLRWYAVPVEILNTIEIGHVEKAIFLCGDESFSRKFHPGKYVIYAGVEDRAGLTDWDIATITILPKPVRLSANETRKGIKLSWTPYDKPNFLSSYEVYMIENNSEIFIKTTKNTNYEHVFSKNLADKKFCFKVRTVLKTGVYSDSNISCAKSPIWLSVKRMGFTNITLIWTKNETDVVQLEYWSDSFRKTINITQKSVEIKNLSQGTTYYFRINRDGVYSNTVMAKTLKNEPPKIERWRDITIIKGLDNKRFKGARVEFRSTQREANVMITDDHGIEKIEFKFEKEFEEVKYEVHTNPNLRKQAYFNVSHIYKSPGVYEAVARVTDTHNVVVEDSIKITVKARPWVSEKVKVSGLKLVGGKDLELFTGKLGLSVEAGDVDGSITEVRFYAIIIDQKEHGVMLIGYDADGTDGWSIGWDTSRFFETHREFCRPINLNGKTKCYLDVLIIPEAVDSDGLKARSPGSKVHILEPLPDLVADSEWEWIKPADSELLDDLGLSGKKIAEIQENMTYELKPKEESVLINRDEKNNYRIIGTIKNEGHGTLSDNIVYQFYMKRRIPCPSWYLQSLGCSVAKLPPLELKVNTSMGTGFICPRANVGSYGGGSPPSCIPLPICHCTTEIASRSVREELKPGNFVQVSALIPEEKLKSFAEEVKDGNLTLGKKVEIIFAIDAGDKILEEDEFNNVVSRDIWLESRIKPQLIKGGNPKSMWYGFDRFIEWLDLTFTFDNKAKFEKELKQASKRLEEAERMLRAKEFETASNLLKDYSNNIESASKLLDKLPEGERLGQSKVLMLVISSYVNVLEDMYRKEIDGEFENAINVSLEAQQKAIEKIYDTEPMAAPMILQFKSGLNPDLEILNVNIPGQILAGEEILINFSVLNSGQTKSDFRITLYEEGNIVKSIEGQKIYPGCMNNYTLTWTAKKGVSEISIGLEEPEDANPENNYVTLNVQVISPVCYSDHECSDANPCTKDICIAKGTAQARCEYIQITRCIDNDGCCPLGCNALNDNDCKSLCGNQICEPNENQENCCQDCGCPEGYECKENVCVLKIYCGNGVCESDENKCTCPEDCGECSGACKEEPCWEWECVSGECQCELQDNCCGNQFCEEGEYYLNCETREFETNCPDCCVPYPLRQDPYPPNACNCPPGTEKIIINPETREFICECPPS